MARGGKDFLELVPLVGAVDYDLLDDEEAFIPEPITKGFSRRPLPSPIPPYLLSGHLALDKASHCPRWSRHLHLARNIFLVILAIPVLLTLVVFSLFPSYTNKPRHYNDLATAALSSDIPGRVNLFDEKIFIAAALYDPDGEILSGSWVDSLLYLVDLIGAENVHVSIYESDGNPTGLAAMELLSAVLPCEHTLIAQNQVTMNMTATPQIVLPDGSVAIKRVAYLAEARNMALRPLESLPQTFDRILFLNDIVFDPVEAAQLLFATNAASGRAKYTAACSADFDNPFKFYDTFATRDLDGYSIGLPVFPFFGTRRGSATLSAVLAQSDAVPVKSCWGGMAAFEARFFQKSRSRMRSSVSTAAAEKDGRSALKFRAEADLNRDASECCLIHADIADAVGTGSSDGVYMNPYIRVAYTEATFRWLWLGKRLERLCIGVQMFINLKNSLPTFNERRGLPIGSRLTKTLWSPPSSSATPFGVWKTEEVHTTRGDMCAVHGLMVHKSQAATGEKNWESLQVPFEVAPLQLP